MSWIKKSLAFFIIFLSMLVVSAGNFELDSVLLKTSIKENAGFENSVIISNSGNAPIRLNCSLNDLENIVSLPEKEVIVAPKESKKLPVRINGHGPGIYTGAIVFESGALVKNLPVIVEVESNDAFFDSNLALFPTSKIYPGDKINADIKIYNLEKPSISDIKSEYFIKDFTGKTLHSESENVVVSDSVSLTKNFDLSSDMKPGTYVLGVILDYNSSISTSSSVFKVSKRQFFDKFDFNFAILITLFGIVILAFLGFVFYSVYSRDKLLDDLKCDYRKKVTDQKAFLRRKEEDNDKKLETGEERKINKAIFNGLRKKQLQALKKTHLDRVKKIKELKRKNKKEEMKEQIKRWKKQGFDTGVLEKSVPDVSDIKKQVSLWKKEGYNTKLLGENFNRKV
jgi:hypothetical protein